MQALTEIDISFKIWKLLGLSFSLCLLKVFFFYLHDHINIFLSHFVGKWYTIGIRVLFYHPCSPFMSKGSVCHGCMTQISEAGADCALNRYNPSLNLRLVFEDKLCGYLAWVEAHNIDLLVQLQSQTSGKESGKYFLSGVWNHDWNWSGCKIWRDNYQSWAFVPFNHLFSQNFEGVVDMERVNVYGILKFILA